MKHYLILEHNILKYPPVLSLINFLFENKKKVVYIGFCSDQKFIREIEQKGGVFHNIIANDIGANAVLKLIRYKRFVKKVSQILDKEYKKGDKIWLLGEQCTWLLHKLIYNYECNIYLFEMPHLRVANRYKILSLSIDYRKVLQNASKVICCEYNRACITQAYFSLKELPYVIPNKYFRESKEVVGGNDLVDSLLEKLKDRKIILYQGGIMYPERRLEELSESVRYLPDDYIVCIMGGETAYKRKLKNKYESSRVLFLPFLSPPIHLEITKKARIGFLTYFPTQGQIENILNVLYCAPNKIYEYAEFGIPMIANDVPALRMQLLRYECGEIPPNFTAKGIAEAVLKIEHDYSKYVEGTKRFYQETDIRMLYKNII